MAAERQVVVCVIGPGRSGTSMTMRVLNLLGVQLGTPDDLVGPGPGGPRGFWERRAILELDDRVLRSQGGSWRRPPRLEPGWERAPELEDLRVEARELIEREFGGHALWGWKDPRASLILPFWQQLLPDMRYVICLRNPIDCAASIAPPDEPRDTEGFYFARRGPRLERALPLWRTYVASALAHTAGRRRTFVSYDEHLEDPRATAARLAGFVGVAPPTPGSEAARAIDEFVDDDLRHHRTPARDVIRDERLPTDVASLYVVTELLRANASDGAAADLYAEWLLTRPRSEA